MESCNFFLAIVKRKCIVNIILQLHLSLFTNKQDNSYC